MKKLLFLLSLIVAVSISLPSCKVIENNKKMVESSVQSSPKIYITTICDANTVSECDTPFIIFVEDDGDYIENLKRKGAEKIGVKDKPEFPGIYLIARTPEEVTRVLLLENLAIYQRDVHFTNTK